MIPLLLTRWRWGLGIAATLAMLGLLAAATHYRKAYHKQRDAVVSMQASIKQAREQWAIAFALKERAYQLDAERIDNAHKDQLAQARALGDDYKRLNRVRPQATGMPASQSCVSQGDGARIPESTASLGIVVSEADFDACTAAVIYGRAAYDWARGLE